MLNMSFSKDDKDNFVAALNFIAKEAKFGTGPTNVKYSIVVRNHFSFLQSIVAKIDSHVLDDFKMSTPDNKKDKAKGKSKDKGKK